ncbi:ABC transporter permease [Hyphomonas polymorpha PS728]|uniref:ABC transporter permease n=1 Tax=Hyphomonas polymorpha PS728 TaxID=1280954 RepID=A0A062VLJ4_9PROT|nr:ABC transporter ATP-binding protein [Hyphomonas polymorpha]KCZ99486.1 ABC transporter permease [Hyphomonas polymorpha PS728]
MVRRRRIEGVRLPLRPLVGSLDRRSLGALILAILCIIVGAGLSAAAPLLLARLVDLLPEGATSAAVLVCLYAGTQGLVRIAAEGRAFFFGRAEQDIVRTFSLSVARHTLLLPLAFVQARSPGAMVQILENGLQGYRLLLQHGVFTLLPGILEITLIGVIIATQLDLDFLAVFMLCGLLYAVVFGGGAARVLLASREVSAARIEVTARLADSFLNIETVKALSGERTILARMDHALEEARQSWRHFYSVRLRNGILVTLIFSAGMLTVLWMGIDRVGTGEMTPGAFLLISAYMIQIVRPIEMLGYAARDIGQGAAFIERLGDILRELPEEGTAGPGVCLPASGGMAVSLVSVSYRPGTSDAVLQDISLDIRPGMRVGLVGASGSGKSTLLRLVPGLLTPSGGGVRIDGVPVGELSLSSLRKQVAFIPQQAGLFQESLAFNLGFPDTDVPDDVAREMLERMRLGTLVAGAPAAGLSGGERQRLAIGRALLRPCRLVLADEPTSALDPMTESAILAELFRGIGEATLILASHRLTAVRGMDLIVVLDRGQVAETGTHVSLMEKNGLYAGMWKAQEE